MDCTDEESVGDLLMYIDNTIQYGEDLDVKIPRVSVHIILEWRSLYGGPYNKDVCYV